MEERITIEALNGRSVTILRRRYLAAEGVEYQVGPTHASGYDNSAWGRAALAREVAEPYRSAVLTVWGDAPTVPDPAQAPADGT